jgi:hypothetical protein
MGIVVAGDEEMAAVRVGSKAIRSHRDDPASLDDPLSTAPVKIQAWQDYLRRHLGSRTSGKCQQNCQQTAVKEFAEVVSEPA